MPTIAIWEVLPTWVNFMIIVMTSFFTLVDPLGNITIFHAYTREFPQKTCNIIARKSCLIACCLTLIFAFLGDYLFDLFGLTFDGLKVAGGIIFFLIGYDMLNTRLSNAKSPTTMLNTGRAEELAVSPLAIPLLCGPGVLINTILLMGEAADNVSHKVAFVGGILVIFLLTWICFMKANKIIQLIGKSGSKIILSLMGLFMMILAVQYFFEGLTPILREIFKINT